MPQGAYPFAALPKHVNGLMADRAIRHALYLERYKSHIFKELMMEFNGKLDPKLTVAVEKALRRAMRRPHKLDAFLKPNRILVQEHIKGMQTMLESRLRDTAAVESEWLVGTLSHMTPIQWNFVMAAPSFVKAIATSVPLEGAFLKDHFKDLSVKTVNNVNRTIRDGMFRGQGIEKIVRRVKGTRAAGYSDGILDRSRHSLRAIVRTSVAGVANGARRETYKANSDIVKAVAIMATLDTRTCTECMAIDGKVFPIDKAPSLPLHWSCRCTDVPVLKSWRELGMKATELDPGTRASMNGQVPGKLNYEQWLRQQDKAIQNEALGPNRAERWRGGLEKIRDFRDSSGNVITLKQLRAKSGLN